MMTDAIDTFETDNPGRRVSDFIPATHQGLPLLRLLLPFTDQQGDVVRWSAIGSIDDGMRQKSWSEFAELSEHDAGFVQTLESAAGILDVSTAAALADVVGPRSMVSLRWTGYGGDGDPTARVNGDQYFISTLVAADVQEGSRLPEYGWDSDGDLAWGARLFPDSILIAATVPLFRQLFADQRVDVVSVRPDDVFPLSAGD